MSKVRFLLAMLMTLLCASLFSSSAFAEGSEGTGAATDLKLESRTVVVNFFQNLSDGNYRAVWGFLSPDSQQYVAAHYAQEFNAKGLDKQAIHDQFSSGTGDAPKTYWEHFKSTLPMDELLKAYWVVDDLDQNESGLYLKMEDNDKWRFHAVFRNHKWFFDMPRK